MNFAPLGVMTYDAEVARQAHAGRRSAQMKNITINNQSKLRNLYRCGAESKTDYASARVYGAKTEANNYKKNTSLLRIFLPIVWCDWDAQKTRIKHIK